MRLPWDILRARVRSCGGARARCGALVTAWALSFACVMLDGALLLSLGRQADAAARFEWTTGRVVEPTSREQVAYEYTVDGASHRGSRLEFAPLLGQDRVAARGGSVYGVGASVPVAFDPWWPSRSTLRTQVSGGHLLWLLGAWALHAGAMVMWSAVRGLQSERRALGRGTASTLPALREQPGGLRIELERPSEPGAFAAWSGAGAFACLVVCVALVGPAPSVGLVCGGLIASLGLGAAGVARLRLRRARGEHHVAVDLSAGSIVFPSRFRASLRRRALRLHDLERWEVVREQGEWTLRVIAHGSNHVRPAVLARDDAPAELDAIAKRVGELTATTVLTSQDSSPHEATGGDVPLARPTVWDAA